MSLILHDFDVMRPGFNFFEDLHRQMRAAEAEMEAMSRQMFRLFPEDFHMDPNATQIQHHEPAVVEENGETKLKMEFDVRQFKPDEVKVKVVDDNVLQVSANHEEKTEHGYSKRQFMRRYPLPEGVDPAIVKPVLTKDGILCIEAAAPSLKPREKVVPIQYEEQNGSQQSTQHGSQQSTK